MCAALADHDSLYGPTANRTGLAFTSVNAKIILEVPAAVYPVYACTVVLNTSEQNVLDRGVQALSLFQ